jgi:hypothetical protein
MLPGATAFDLVALEQIAFGSTQPIVAAFAERGASEAAPRRSLYAISSIPLREAR